MIGNTVGPNKQEYLNRQADKAKAVASFVVCAQSADNFLDRLDALIAPVETTSPVIHSALSDRAVSPILRSVFPDFKHA